MKRILAIDGGGVRGVLALEILREVERLVAERHGKQLHEYFDLIAGTSTGAIIGSLLSWGYDVAAIEPLYSEHARTVFTPAPLFKRHRHHYSSAPLGALLRQHFQEPDGSLARFGSPSLKTLLLVTMQNASSGSTWPLCNHPKATFNNRSNPDCNLDLPLWEIVRASAAAPVYFEPEDLQLGAERMHFIDGGVSPYNNPALAAYLHATLPEYKIQWPPGEDELLIISVGTGRFRPPAPSLPVDRQHLLSNARMAMLNIINSVTLHEDMLCRCLGRCLAGHPIDSEVGDLRQSGLPVPKQFTYLRYQQVFSASELQGAPTRGDPTDMDNLEVLDWLREKGRDFARQEVKTEHLL